MDMSGADALAVPPRARRRLPRSPLYARYLGVSALALAADMSLFLGLLAGHAPPAPAAAIGYLSGDVAHWLMSSRTVFARHAAPRGKARLRQQARFFASGFLGLAITTGIVAGGAALGIDPRVAKLVAVGASVNAVFLMRRFVVFA